VQRERVVRVLAQQHHPGVDARLAHGRREQPGDARAADRRPGARAVERPRVAAAAAGRGRRRAAPGRPLTAVVGDDRVGPARGLAREAALLRGERGGGEQQRGAERAGAADRRAAEGHWGGSRMAGRRATGPPNIPPAGSYRAHVAGRRSVAVRLSAGGQAWYGRLVVG
jgi:hypothetical protein